MKYLIKSLLFTAFSLSLSGAVYAQTTSPTTVVRTSSIIASSTQNTVTVATVNIYNATSTHNGNMIAVAFKLSNRVGVQPGVKYGVYLTKEIPPIQKGMPAGQAVVDQKIYDEVVFLGENSSVQKVVVYQAPSYLEGDYKIFVKSENKNGFPFATAFAGNISLTKTASSSPYIQTDSCFLTVEGETGGKKYAPMQGVDISPTETLISNCTVENTTNSPVTVIPSFITHSYSAFGNVVQTQGGDNSPITLAPNEKKLVSTKLPKASAPLLYNVSIRYGSLSNEETYAYTISGLNGSIQNVFFDKSSYKKGDTAKGSFAWSMFAGPNNSRKGTSTLPTAPAISIVLKDGQGNDCSSVVNQDISKEKNFVIISVPVTRDCVSVRAEVKLTDAKLGVLSQDVFTISSTTPESGVNQSKVSSNILNRSVAGLAVLVIIILAFVLYRRIPKASLAVILFAVLASGVQGAKADTFYNTFGGWNGNSVHSVTANLDKSTYVKGENMVLSVSTTDAYNCGLYYGSVGCLVAVFASVGTAGFSSSYSLVGTGALNSVSGPDILGVGQTNASGVSNLTAPSTTGTYYVTLVTNTSLVTPTGNGGFNTAVPVFPYNCEPYGFYHFCLSGLYSTNAANNTIYSPVYMDPNSLTFSVTNPAPSGPAPTINFLPFSPSTIAPGQSSTFSFTSSGAAMCFGAGPVFSGTVGTSATNVPTPTMNTTGSYPQQIVCVSPTGVVGWSNSQTLTVGTTAPTVNVFFSVLQKFQDSLSNIFASSKNITGNKIAVAER